MAPGKRTKAGIQCQNKREMKNMIMSAIIINRHYHYLVQ